MVVSSTAYVCWKMKSFGVPAIPYNATAHTSPCAERTARHTPTTARGNYRNARLKQTSLSSNKGPVVSLENCVKVQMFCCVFLQFYVSKKCYCLISIVCLLVSCWKTLVEGAHSLSLPQCSPSAINCDDTWNTDFMFHS